MIDVSAPEIEVFADHAAWLAPQLPDPTRRGLAAWMSAHLSGNARERLQAQMPLLHPLHEAAENAVLELLARDLTRSVHKVSISQYPGRSVDWQATYIRAVGVTPYEFVSSSRAEGVDRDTLGALTGLATTWAMALETLEDSGSQARAQRLRRACIRRPTLGPVAFGTRHARALMKLDHAAESAISLVLKVLGFWDSAFGGLGDRQSLIALAKTLRVGDMANINTLLEVTARLSIARVATSLRVMGAGPIWRLTPDSWARQNAIEMRAGPWRCHLSKGLLSNGAGRRQADGAGDSMAAMGLRSIGSQPDIVMKFWHTAAPEVTIFFLGDAKRNATGCGEDYLRDSIGVAAAYSCSYARPLGLHLPEMGAACKGRVNPMVTLFCAQSVPSVVGVRGSAEEQADAIKNAPRLPAFMAFDLASHFGPRGPAWSSPVLEQWFQRISNEACALLTGQRRHSSLHTGSLNAQAAFD